MPGIEKDTIKKLVTFQKEVEKVFHDVFTVGSDASYNQVAYNINYPVPVDIIEGHDTFTIEIEIPGVKKDNIKLSILNNSLIIKGLKSRPTPKNSKQHYYCIERNFGKFHRIIDLPSTAATSKIAASHSNGLLTITLQKVSDRRGRMKEIKID